MKKYLAALILLLSICLPAAAMAQTTDDKTPSPEAAQTPDDQTLTADPSNADTHEELNDVDAIEPDDEYPEVLRNGFSVVFNVGPDFIPNDYVFTFNQDDDLSFPAIGGNMNLNIGYKTSYFGIYLDLFLRAAWASKNIKDSHTISSYNDADNNSHKVTYNLFNKGDWDGYIGGIGLMMMGFIPFSEHLVIDLGLGFDWCLGTGVFDNDDLAQTFDIKFRVGFDIPITYSIMLGMAVEVNYLFSTTHISPMFTLIYTY